jgi:hypothetical protein
MADVIQTLGLQDSDIDALTALNFTSDTDPANEVAIFALVLSSACNIELISRPGCTMEELHHTLDAFGRSTSATWLSTLPPVPIMNILLKIHAKTMASAEAILNATAPVASPTGRTFASGTSGRRRSAGGSPTSPPPSSRIASSS